MRKVVLAAVLALMAGGAQAATLNVIGGILHGASGVDVGGSLYDVEFVDGSCIDLFDGCDDPTDFTFTDLASATLAAQALLEQVFLDGANLTSPGSPYFSMSGCTNLFSGFGCGVATPYSLDGPSSFLSVIVFNPPGLFPSGPDPFVHPGLHRSYSTVGIGGETYGRWAPNPIPEPSTALLLGLGLAGMAARRRV